MSSVRIGRRSRSRTLEVTTARVMTSVGGVAGHGSGALTDFLTLYDTVLDGASETFTGFLLVSVISSAVQQTVASLEGVVNSLHIVVSAGVFVDVREQPLRPRIEA